MTKYDKYIKQTRLEFSSNRDLSLKSDLTVNNVIEEKSKKPEAEDTNPEKLNILQKENLESLQKIVNSKKENLKEESKTIDYYDCNSLR